MTTNLKIDRSERKNVVPSSFKNDRIVGQIIKKRIVIRPLKRKQNGQTDKTCLLLYLLDFEYVKK